LTLKNNINFNHIYLGTNEKNYDEYLCEMYDAKISRKVGFCKYYRMDPMGDDCFIEYIQINEEYRRKGYGTDIVKELQRMYRLQWDYRFTDDGRQWFNALISRKIVKNSSYV